MASCLLSLLIFTLTLEEVTSDLVLEDGYEVSTLLDGHKHNINPYSVQPRSGSSDVIVLDSSRSSFYTVSFISSHESTIQHVSGNGAGMSDGELNLGKFDRPRSFAVGPKGHVYVADKANHAIRKISQSGVSTIAGGYSHKTGNTDGPAQNSSFSSDFDLVFLPERCALLITDRGNQLLRSIHLKDEECDHHEKRRKLAVLLLDAIKPAIVVIIVFGVFVLLLHYNRRGYRGDGGDVYPRSPSASSRIGAAFSKLTMLVISNLSLMLRLRNAGAMVVREEAAMPLHAGEGSTKGAYMPVEDLISFEQHEDESRGQ